MVGSPAAAACVQLYLAAGVWSMEIHLYVHLKCCRNRLLLLHDIQYPRAYGLHLMNDH